MVTANQPFRGHSLFAWVLAVASIPAAARIRETNKCELAFAYAGIAPGVTVGWARGIGHEMAVASAVDRVWMVAYAPSNQALVGGWISRANGSIWIAVYDAIVFLAVLLPETAREPSKEAVRRIAAKLEAVVKDLPRIPLASVARGLRVAVVTLLSC
jgi:hypothetical protein